MKKVVLFALMYCSVPISMAQYTLDKKARFGFNLGVNHSILKKDKSNTENFELSNGFGGTIGVLADLKLSNNIYIVPEANLSFITGESKLNFTDDTQLNVKVPESVIGFFVPIVYKFKGEKHRPYLIAGPNIRIPLHADEKSRLWNSDLAFDFGIGLEKGMKFFCFSPELRYSYGWQNVNRNLFFPNIYYHSISLVLKLYG